jgi:hypothetical protein
MLVTHGLSRLFFFGYQQQECYEAPVASHTSAEGTILSHKDTKAQRIHFSTSIKKKSYSFICLCVAAGFVNDCTEGTILSRQAKR